VLFFFFQIPFHREIKVTSARHCSSTPPAVVRAQTQETDALVVLHRQRKRPRQGVFPALRLEMMPHLSSIVCLQMGIFATLPWVLPAGLPSQPQQRPDHILRSMQIHTGFVSHFQFLSRTKRPVGTIVAAKRKKSSDGHIIFTDVTQAAPLAPKGQPPMIITYTNDGACVSNWLTSNVGKDVQFLGFDTETVPSVRKNSDQFKGPATLQLATAEGECLVVHLAHVPRKNCFASPASGGIKDAKDGAGLLSRLRGVGFDDLAEVLRETRVIKAGVGIDADAIDLWRENRLVLAGRFDLGGIGAKSHGRIGLKDLAEMVVPGLVLPKSKKLTMSDWAMVPLTQNQLEYAAADAFAGAAVFSTLKTSAPDRPSHGNPVLPHFNDVGCLRDLILQGERPVEELEARATRRRAAKLDMQARQAVLDIADMQSRQAVLHMEQAKDPYLCEEAVMDAAERKLFRELTTAPDVFEARLNEARCVFLETRPRPPLSADDFAGLGMLSPKVNREGMNV
jgi:hypothetical protein